MNTKKAKPKLRVEMPGVRNSTTNPTLEASPAAVHLATVAAPFAAAGMSDADAADRAFSLMIKCDQYLDSLLHDGMFERPEVGLDQLRKEVGRDDATLRKYFKEFDPVQGPKMWKSLRKGGTVSWHVTAELKLMGPAKYRVRYKKPKKT